MFMYVQCYTQSYEPYNSLFIWHGPRVAQIAELRCLLPGLPGLEECIGGMLWCIDGIYII